ncbi:hypothetical protein F503_04062 [Ophiostoma piceae UAMH 11346]|uniref:Uncharacterized protein n=1 Tax=Ophiostoma piceae (strain UAMH 11346) TaxID=1262450 RepID=S3C952_OPHP1|nr:hypothetical protein F503_04062 [Ophiostoma piceae UAMH 11346]
MDNNKRIYDHARACEEAFSLITSDQNAPSYVVAETLRQRFEQWSSNMGVFAVAQFSLDTRLEHSDSLRSMVLDLLELMKTGLDRVDKFRVDDEDGQTQESIIEQMRAEEAPDALLRRMLSGKEMSAGGKQMSSSEMHEALVKQVTRSPGIVASVLVESLRTLKSVVDSLDRLGSAIRQSSSAERLTERIQKYMKKSNDGGVLEDIVYLRLKFMLVDGRKYKDGELPDNARGATLLLCRQLAVSVAYRYSAVIYRRHHEQKRILRREDKPQRQKVEIHEDVAQRAAVVRHENDHHLPGPMARPSAIPSGLRSPPSERTESMVSRPESAVAKKKYASSQASFRGANSVVSIQPGNVALPKPPTIVSPAVDAACPYCLVRYPKSKYAEQRWWEHHIQSDLKLYTCISEDCCQPPLLFERYAEWKKHMDNAHTLQWTMNVHSPASWSCDLDHNEEWFSKEEDYESHMLARHSDQINGYEMDDLKELASAKQPRTWDTCPICNCIPLTVKTTSTNARGISTEKRQQGREELLKHIGQHLKEIGLLSVGYLDDNDAGDSEASRNASVASLRSRDYVPKAETVDNAWVFDDSGLVDYVDIDYKSSDLLFTDTQTNNLPEWQVLWKTDLLDEEQTLRDCVDFAKKWRSPSEVEDCQKALESWLHRFAQRPKLDDADMTTIMNGVAQDGDIYKEILAIVSTVYRPVALTELLVLCSSPELYSPERIHEIVQLCSSFLTIRKGSLRFVNESAKDNLVSNEPHDIFPSGILNRHANIASRSLTALSSKLKRDMYDLNDPGCYIYDVSKPDHDPLASIRYACLFWVDHLVQAGEADASLHDGGQVHRFLQEKFLYWLEALSLLGRISDGVSAVEKLESLDWEKGEYHHGSITSVVFSPNGTQLASGSYDGTIKLWDTASGECTRTLQGHTGSVTSVVFSPNGTQLASGSDDETIRLWDTASGECTRTLEGHTDIVMSVIFSPNGTQLASGSYDKTIKLWDTASGECTRTLQGHSDSVTSAVFSSNGRQYGADT